jgi:hypothetical protein
MKVVESFERKKKVFIGMLMARECRDTDAKG